MPSLRHAYNIADLRALARYRLPRGLFEFVDRGTEDEVALRNNRAAFERIKLIPRGLVDVSRRSSATTLFGKSQALPLVIAPTGIAGLLSFRGELALARAAAAAQIPFVLSTAAVTGMEKVAQAGGQLWFQLYMWPDHEASYRLITRASVAGYETLVITIDTTAAPNREYNARNGFALPIRFGARNVLDALTHPGWLMRVFIRHLVEEGPMRFENYPEHLQAALIARRGISVASPKSETMDWNDLARLRERWKGRLVVKGVLDVDDARAAVGCGADGIVVSNHGGRNFDSVPASIDVLPEIVAAVGDQTTVLIDSGFLRGSDVVKAITLGAKAVLIGRAPLYGLAAGGEAGAAHALALLRDEIDRTMVSMGCCSIAEVGPDRVRVQP